MDQSIEAVEDALTRGDVAAAAAALTTVLEARGDALSKLTLRVMGESAFAPDAMATALDRLVRLVREQEAQIEALRAMVETAL